MNSSSICSSANLSSPYDLLFHSLSLIPISHYLIALIAIITAFLYNFLEWHFLGDFLTGFRGQRVTLTFNSDSKIYDAVASKCKILRGRYQATPWLASPHLQTTFLNFFGRPPVFTYRRKIFRTSDGGTIALDWLLKSDVVEGSVDITYSIPEDDKTPLVIIVPGLTSDSNSSSDCFYNAGWTEDIRVIVQYLHIEYPSAPLYLIGTSIGANVLVKYLGEEGENTPIAGAVAICSPWDLLIGDRFIGRRLVQKFYDIALAIGLRGYAQLHQPQFSRLANWEGIQKSRSIRDFDNHATVIVGNYETVDTYYRRCSSAGFVRNVSVPLLCISSLDDPLCTREAIPWDECRLNKNIILATTEHGGHLAFFEGITASSLWWVRASNEYLKILNQSSYTHTQKMIKPLPPTEPSIDHGPFVNFAEDGMLAAVANEQTINTDGNHSALPLSPDEELETESTPLDSEPTTEQVPRSFTSKFLTRHLSQVSRYSRSSMWLLVYISIVSSWPLVGSALYFFFKKKIKATPRRRSGFVHRYSIIISIPISPSPVSMIASNKAGNLR
ncbi:hypothetical protein V2J09_008541 [Rumex salicifolius]